MAEDKELYGYDEEDIITLEYDNGDEEECRKGNENQLDAEDNRTQRRMRLSSQRNLSSKKNSPDECNLP